MSVIYLYSYRLPVQLWMTNHGAPNKNPPMINYNTKVYKNNFNIIDLVVRNNDRKPVKLVDARLEVTIANVETGLVVLTKNAVNRDEVNGRAQLIITGDETKNWPLGGYKYNVRLLKDWTQQEFLYTDINNSAVDYFELIDSVGGSLIPAQTFLGSELTHITIDWDEMKSQFVSGAILAENQIGNNTGLYSVAVYQTGWKGRFRIQGSLQNISPTEASWFDVELMPAVRSYVFDGASRSPTGFSFSLNLRWMRWVFDPDPTNSGEIDKIIYKIT